jgi:hypothetical protein
LTQPGWEVAANYMCERDETYSTSALRVSAVVQAHTYDDTEAPALVPFAELIEYLDIDPGILHIQQETSHPGRNHIRLGSVKLQLNPGIPSLGSVA